LPLPVSFSPLLLGNFDDATLLRWFVRCLAGHIDLSRSIVQIGPVKIN